jgi:hypothetical protein
LSSLRILISFGNWANEADAANNDMTRTLCIKKKPNEKNLPHPAETLEADSANLIKACLTNARAISCSGAGNEPLANYSIAVPPFVNDLDLR